MCGGRVAGILASTAWSRAIHGPKLPHWTFSHEVLMRVLHVDNDNDVVEFPLVDRPQASDAIPRPPACVRANQTAFDYPAVRSMLSLAQAPTPNDLRTKEVVANGVHAEVCWVADAGPDADAAAGTEPPAFASCAVVLVYFHGGGFVFGRAHEFHAFVRAQIRTLQAAAKRRGLAGPVVAIVPDYRLAPEHPWPAQLRDAEAVAAWVADRAPTDRVVLTGDSAGGAIAAHAAQYSAEKGSPVACSILMSPWVEFAVNRPSYAENAPFDFLPVPRILETARIVLQGISPTDPDTCPMHRPAAVLAAAPPALVLAGDAEVFRDSIHAYADRALSAGAALRCETWGEMTHVWHMSAGQPEARASLRSAADWAVSRVADGRDAPMPLAERGRFAVAAGTAWDADAAALAPAPRRLHPGADAGPTACAGRL